MALKTTVDQGAVALVEGFCPGSRVIQAAGQKVWLHLCARKPKTGRNWLT
jgi:hypothetical protein